MRCDTVSICTNCTVYVRNAFSYYLSQQLVAWTNELQYKDTKPYMLAFLKNWPVYRHCGIVFNRFYILEIHSLSGLYFRPSLWTVAPMDEGTILMYCCPSTLSSLWPSPLPKLNVLYIQTVCVTGAGEGGVFSCPVDHILQEFYTLFLARFRTYRIATPPQTNDQKSRH